MLREITSGSHAERAAAAFDKVVAVGLRVRAANGGGGAWSLAEAGLDDWDYRWLIAWAAGLTDENVRAALDGAAVRGQFDGRWQSSRVVFGTVCLLLLAEVARRRAGVGQLWPDVADADLFPRAEGAVFVQQNGQPRTPTQAVLGAIAEAAEAIGLRRVATGNRHYLTVMLQYGFSRPAYQAQVSNWLAGAARSTVTAIDVLRGREPSPLSPSSKSFADLWSTLLRVARGEVGEAAAQSAIASSPWVLPEWAGELYELAADAGVPPLGGEPTSPPTSSRSSRAARPTVAVPLLSDPVWRWTPPEAPTIVCQVQALAAGGLSADHYDVIADGRKLCRAVIDAQGGYRLVGQTGVDALEVRLPTARPTVDVRLVDPTATAVVDQQAVPLWDAAAPVTVLYRDGPTTRELNPDRPMDRAKAYDLVVRSDLAVTPTVPRALLATGFRLYRLAAGWPADLRVSAGHRTVWTPVPKDVVERPATAAPPSVTMLILKDGDDAFKLVLTHRADVTVSYVWVDGHDVPLSPPATGQTTAVLPRSAVADPRRVDATVGLRWGPVDLRPVRCWAAAPVYGLFKVDEDDDAGDGDRLTAVAPTDTLFPRPADLRRLVFVPRPAPPTGQGEGPPTWYLTEGSRLVGPVANALADADRFAGTGGPVCVQDGLFNRTGAATTVAARVLGGGALRAHNLSVHHPPSPATGTLQVGFAHEYTTVTADHRLVVWTADGQLVSEAPRDGLVTYGGRPRPGCEIDWPAEYGADVRAAALWCRGERAGAAFRPGWCERAWDDADRDPVRLAAILRWFRAPILDGPAGKFLYKLTSEHAPAFLAAWAARSDDAPPLITDDFLPLGPTSRADEPWWATVRDLLSGWSPKDPDDADAVINAVAGDRSADPDRDAAVALARVCPLLFARVFDVYATDPALSAAQWRRKFLRLRRLLLGLPEGAGDGAVEDAADEHAERVAKTLAKHAGGDAVDETFLAHVAGGAATVLEGKADGRTRGNVSMLCQFPVGRQMVAAELAKGLADQRR